MMDARVEYQSRVIIFNNGDEAIIPREYWIYSSGRVADPEPTIPTRIRVLARIQSLKILATDRALSRVGPDMFAKGSESGFFLVATPILNFS